MTAQDTAAGRAPAAPAGEDAAAGDAAAGARAADVTSPEGQRSVLMAGAAAAAAVHATGLAVLTLIVLTGFVAAPHAGFGLPAVLRTAAVAWLAGHHVAFALRGAGRIGMLPLGLALVPGALAWRAGKWVVRSSGVRRLRHVGFAALALAAPYGVLSGALAVAGRSALAAPSVLQAAGCGFALALAFGGLGGARALAPWPQLLALLPPRSRAVVAGVAGSLGALAAAGAMLAAVSLAVHLRAADALTAGLAPGVIGLALLLLLQAAYLPNAVIWAVAFMLGPGFAVGPATVVSPGGAHLGRLPAFPLLAALPPGLAHGLPGGAQAAVLALPLLAGILGGVLVIRTGGGPVTGGLLSAGGAPARGLMAGGAAGLVTGVLAAVSGGPLGNGALAAVGPSPWQAGLVAALELGAAAAVTAGAANYVALRRAGALPRSGALRPRHAAGRPAADSAPARPAPARPAPAQPEPDRPGEARQPGPADPGAQPGAQPGPAGPPAVPGQRAWVPDSQIG